MSKYLHYQTENLGNTFKHLDSNYDVKYLCPNEAFWCF